MSNRLITASFPARKHTEPITKRLPQRKVKKEPHKTADDEKQVYPDAKAVADLALLRDFDMRCEYGPCTGITRLERWKRAQDYGLKPPAEIPEILEIHKNDLKFTECVWHDELI